MKLVFSGAFEELRGLLCEAGDNWDESQPNKKVLRHEGGVLNWYESTGTIQFQGRDPGKSQLESIAQKALAPDDVASGDEVLNFPWDVEPEEETPRDDQPEISPSTEYLKGSFKESELVIGIVSAVGTESSRVITCFKDRLTQYGYQTFEVRVSELLRQPESTSEYERIKSLMAAGDERRKQSSNNAILAHGVAQKIAEIRDEKVAKRAFIVNSLKHPDEVELLRKIYGQGFYLIGIHADKPRRLGYLTEDKGLTRPQAAELTELDEDENIPHGQRTRDTYHLADFFLNFGKNDDHVKNSIKRFLELVFSHPYKNPTFDEFAMFMAFSSSVRSGDLSRQVGSVIARSQQIIATGANECPVSGGGLYWSHIDPTTGEVIDATDGKDFMREQDSNKAEQKEIINHILRNVADELPDSGGYTAKIKEILEKSRISDLTEFGRVVHAEMEAILSCARAGINCIGTTMYCTTFPCHNCAKHIVASGISRVVYVEPYPKSKALELHSESIELNTSLDVSEDSPTGAVVFEPFTGIGARRFLDFFSMNLGMGNKLKRKNKDGTTVQWDKESAGLRVSLLPASYLDIENAAASVFTPASDPF